LGLRERAERAVGERRGLLEDAQRANHGTREVFAADAEVMERPLGLRAPVAVGGDLNRAHAVGFDAGVGAWQGRRSRIHRINGNAGDTRAATDGRSQERGLLASWSARASRPTRSVGGGRRRRATTASTGAAAALRHDGSGFGQRERTAAPTLFGSL